MRIASSSRRPNFVSLWAQSRHWVLRGLGTSETSIGLRTGKAMTCLSSGTVTVLPGDSECLYKKRFLRWPELPLDLPHGGTAAHGLRHSCAQCSRTLPNKFARRADVVLLPLLSTHIRLYSSAGDFS